jgi:hypothetical protein
MSVEVGKAARVFQRESREVRRIVRGDILDLSAGVAHGVMVMRLSVRKLVMRMPMAEVVFKHHSFLDKGFERAIERAAINLRAKLAFKEFHCNGRALNFEQFEQCNSPRRASEPVYSKYFLGDSV